MKARAAGLIAHADAGKNGILCKLAPSGGCYNCSLMDQEWTDPTSYRREVSFPHDAEVQPLIAVRNGVVQASLTLLRDAGLYERYAKLVQPATLATHPAGSSFTPQRRDTLR